jgi:hypothetical protein
MKQIIALGMCAILIFNSCATIISGGGKKDVLINSAPPNANYRVIDEKGMVIYEGITPKVVSLSGGEAYFKMKRYEVRFTKKGYYPAAATINSTFNPWYIGNLCFGGLIGMLLVDPLTGAMYKIENDKVTVVLNPSASNNSNLTTTPIVDLNAKPATIPTTVLATDTINKIMPIVKDSIPSKKIQPSEIDYYPAPTKKDSLR